MRFYRLMGPGCNATRVSGKWGQVRLADPESSHYYWPVNICDYNGYMMEISASKFKEQCLSLLDNLDPDGIVVTKHGKPVARLIPANSGCAELIGSLQGKVKVTGGVFSTGIGWHAES